MGSAKLQSFAEIIDCLIYWLIKENIAEAHIHC